MQIALPHDPARVLIIKPSAIGDVVHALPVLDLLRRRWPSAQFSWLVTPACAGILDGHPMLHEVIRFERKLYGRAWRSPKMLAGLFRFTRELKAKKFDIAIDLQGLFRSGWLTAVSGAPVRVGLGDARELAPLFYTHAVPVGDRERHAIERYLCVPEALGCGRGPVRFPFATDDVDRARIRAIVPQRYAVLMPGTNWLTKRWPVEKFAALVGPLRERFGLEVVAAGAPHEASLCDAVGGIVNLAGKTTLRELVALIEGAALVVANDSGPMHIAAALGRPLVTPFGPTNPVRTGPYGRMDSVIRVEIPCSPCYSRTCSHVSCLQWVKPEAVLALASEQMGRAVG